MVDIDKIKELVGDKEFEAAKTLIEEGLKEKPDNVELLKLAGLASVNLQLWTDGKRYFETAVKYEPEDATSWFYLGNCYEKICDFISAKNAFITVIKFRPEYMEAYKSLCIILMKIGDTANAIIYAQIAAGLNSDDYIFDFILGTAYMKAKDFESAIEPLKKALEKDPDNITVINSIGTCSMASGKIDEAIEAYEKALKLCPESSISYYNLGSAYQIRQEHEKAVEYFEKAVELEEDETYLQSLAMSEVKIGDYKCALKHYKQLALLCPGKENYKYNIVICYEALGDYETAIKMLEGIVYVNPKFIMPAQKLASLYIKTNQLSKAKDLYDNILLKEKVTAETLHQYAILSSSLQDTETAERILKKVIRMTPDMARAHKDLGTIYLNKRLFDYAEEEFKTALNLAPDDFEIVFEYGNYMYSISKNKEAEDYYKRALEIEPKNPLALTFMALNKLVLNRVDEAKECIMKAIESEPHHEYIQFCAGRILYAKGEYEEAKRYLISAVEQNPDIETQNALALTYYKLGDYEQALNIFKNINTKSPKSISVLMDIARCYENLDDKENALSYLDKVVEIFPDDEDAHEMIRRLS